MVVTISSQSEFQKSWKYQISKFVLPTVYPDRAKIIHASNRDLTIALFQVKHSFVDLINLNLKRLHWFRNSRSQMFFKISVLKNFAIFTRKHWCWSLYSIKLQGWGLPILHFLVIDFVAILCSAEGSQFFIFLLFILLQLKCFLFLFFPSQEYIFSFEDFCLARVLLQGFYLFSNMF